MTKYQIHLNDWQRILFGEAPPIFLLEVFLRTIVVYISLLLILRWLGKRMSGQLTILEMAVMLTLGAIVSVGMQVPDRGIALSMFVLVCTLIFQRGLSWWGIKSARVEELSHGKISTLLKDGVMDMEEMRRCLISRQQLLAQLRSKGIFSLGQLRRVYLEAGGLFTIIKNHKPAAGLSTFPSDDNKILGILHRTNELACTNCGTLVPFSQSAQNCPNCSAITWTAAVVAG